MLENYRKLSQFTGAIKYVEARQLAAALTVAVGVQVSLCQDCAAPRLTLTCRPQPTCNGRANLVGQAARGLARKVL